jgi:threonyl-tRNA synthetase
MEPPSRVENQPCNLWCQRIACPFRTGKRFTIFADGATKTTKPPLGGLSFGYCFANENSGAGEGIRTLDPDLGKVVLYH